MFLNITLKKCSEDLEYEQFIRFFLKYRNQMTPAYPLSYAIQVLAEQVQNGHIIIGLDESGEVMGSLAYYYGTPDQDYVDKQNILIEVLLIKEEFQRSTAFIQGFDFFVQEIESSGGSIEHVLFYAHKESAYLRRLYSKFAKKVSEREAHLGIVDVYAVSFKEFSRFTRGFRRKGNKARTHQQNPNI